MGSYKPPKQSFNSLELDQLQWVFDAMWSEVQARYPARDSRNDETLKSALRRKLFAFACTGVDDPAELLSQIIEVLPLSYDLPVPGSSAFRRRRSFPEESP
jgi:hypothetical protein